MKTRLWLGLVCLGVAWSEMSFAQSVTVSKLESGVKTSLRGLSVVSDQVVWVSGAKGTILRTVDSGKSWKQYQLPDNDALDYRDVQGFSADVAVFLSAGSPARIYRTDNGGKSFRLTYENKDKDIFFDGMAFWDQQNGIAFSDPIKGRLVLLRTKDGGKSWVTHPAKDSPVCLEGEFGFAASGTGIAIGKGKVVLIGMGGKTSSSGARVLRSTSRGADWNAVVTPILRGESAGIFSIALDGDQGIAVGGDYKDPDANESIAAFTNDSGKTWTLCPSMPRGYRSAVATWKSGKSSSFVCIGPGGSDISHNGKSWQRLDDTAAHAIGFAKRFGFASGADGTILRFEKR